MIPESGRSEMGAVDHRPRVFQFGVFELNVHSGELRKHGIEVKLQRQPLQILAILLERPGEVVTREEIQKRLWPDNTYVDFENAINSAMRKLRDVLGDTADNPRFVETLSRRGYRFIYPISGGAGALPVVVPEAPRKQYRSLWAALVVVLAVAAGTRFWIANSRDEATSLPAPPIPLTSYPGYQLFPAFSPEGTRVAFSWDEPGKRPSHIYVKMIGPGEPVRLTTSPSWDFAPAWSPDGRSIAFLRSLDDYHASVMVIPAMGGQERELTRIAFNSFSDVEHWRYNVAPSYLAWSGDGKWLLAVDGDTPDFFKTYRITRIFTETGEKRPLTAPPRTASGDGTLALSPDGKTLAFTRAVTLLVSDIYVVPLSKDLLPTAEPQRITFDRKEIDGLSWTADGRALVFPSTRGGRLELWRIPAKPLGKPVRLAVAGDDPVDVQISREGHRLIYSHTFENTNIWRVSLRGSQTGQATNLIPSTRSEFHLRYSPDGTRIAFEAPTGVNSGFSESEEIWVANDNGSNPVQLTFFGNAWAGSPRWSSDGQKIAFDCNAAGNWDVYVVSSHGGKPVRLTTSSADDLKPSWSRDGKWIYFSSKRTGTFQIWKIPAGGGKESQLTKNGGMVAFESTDGGSLYYSGGADVWRIPVSGGSATRILECPVLTPFAPAKHGVYFLDRRDAHLKLLDLKTHTIKTIAPVAGQVRDEISISPDERWMVYEKTNYAGSELMLVENFR
ncbi:MAG: winged helix-turn-helix domain-containing protein [Terriglobia bacterium]